MSARKRFLRDFSRAIADESAGIFVGAGTSMAAGYPSWKKLLEEIAEELGLELADQDDLAAIAQWAIRADGLNRARVNATLFDQIGPDRTIPPALEVIARLPLRHIWTTNYDRLIERALSKIGRPYDLKATRAQLSVKGAQPGSVKIYKMHGTIDDTNGLVISTDDYELYRDNRGPFLNLLEAEMMSRTFLFTGVSLTDPNIRHVLSSIRQSFPNSASQHYLITKTPDRSDFENDDAFQARTVRHKHWASDLVRYGFNVVEVPTYGAIDELLLELERYVSRHRIWVSGSFPEDVSTPASDFVRKVAALVGKQAADKGFSLVSGSGLTVGPAALGGFLDGLQRTGAWDLERRLIVRPFPQPSPNSSPDQAQKERLRQEMARLSGTMVVISGLKKTSGGPAISADGVMREFEIAKAKQSFIIPIGSTGGAATTIATMLKGSSAKDSGPNATRPTDDELDKLSDNSATLDDISRVVSGILSRRK